MDVSGVCNFSVWTLDSGAKNMPGSDTWAHTYTGVPPRLWIKRCGYSTDYGVQLRPKEQGEIVSLFFLLLPRFSTGRLRAVDTL